MPGPPTRAWPSAWSARARTCSSPTTGFRGLALKLDGELATIEREGEGLVCGGGARLPSASAKAAGWGLAGIEFGVNIPGTAGGAVRMNANAYGGQLAEVLEWVDVFTATGRDRRTPDLLGFAYRSSNLAPGEVVARASFRLHADDPAAIRARLERDARQAARGAALGDQDLRLDLQEPRGRARRGAQRRPAARGGGLSWPAAGWRPLLREARQLRREHRRGDDRRRAGADGEGRRRVHERFGVVLEPEVQVLGEVSWPEGWEL